MSKDAKNTKKAKKYITVSGDAFNSYKSLLSNDEKNIIQGKDFQSALRSLNGSDNCSYPLTEDDIINNATDYKKFLKSFKYMKDFKYICDLAAQSTKIKQVLDEKIEIEENEKITPIETSFIGEAKEIFSTHKGIAYLITCELNGKEYLIKIGQTIKSFQERLSSYNCGTLKNRLSKGTCSTTNFFILQTMVCVNKAFKLYINDCSKSVNECTWAKTKLIYPSSQRLAIESIAINKHMKLFHKKPIGNTQADSGEEG